MVLPICAKCNKQVNKMVTFRDELTRRWVYIVYCHGEEEKADLDDETCVSCNSILVGKAFIQKILPSIP